MKLLQKLVPFLQKNLQSEKAIAQFGTTKKTVLEKTEADKFQNRDEFDISTSVYIQNSLRNWWKFVEIKERINDKENFKVSFSKKLLEKSLKED